MDNQKTILVVDDEDNIRFLIQKELEDEGYKVIAVDSGEVALETLEKCSIDLVTLDMRMNPGMMDGIETLRKIKAQYKELPVIICSGFPSYKEDFATWASEAYVVKTGDMALGELKDKIKEILAKISR